MGADKGYDTKALMVAVRAVGVTPHVARDVTGTADRVIAFVDGLERVEDMAIAMRELLALG